MIYGIYDNNQLIARFTAPLSVRSNSPVFVSNTLSLKRFAAKTGAQRWEIESGLEPLSFNANKLFSLFVTKGFTSTFNILVPQNYGVANKITAANTIVATGSAGASSVTITKALGVIPAGTFIRFSNHTKVYMVTEDCNNSTTLNIFPKLKLAMTSIGLNYKKGTVFMPCYLDTDSTVGMTYTDGVLMDLGTVKFIEAL